MVTISSADSSQIVMEIWMRYGMECSLFPLEAKGKWLQWRPLMTPSYMVKASEDSQAFINDLLGLQVH